MDCIRVRGARQNNLQGIDVDLPLGKLIVVTGPSGSGKSSFAFDTVYAEGQRRYVETFSPYTRQFIERMDKPQVDSIEGIPPAIAIEQVNYVKTTRSTVGTITEIQDYLKTFLPRAVKGFCPSCGSEIRPETAASIARHAAETLSGKTLIVAFGVPVPPDRMGDPQGFFDFLREQGYLRVWCEGAPHRTDEPPSIRRLPGLVRVIQDRAQCPSARLGEAIDAALAIGKGVVYLIEPETGEEHPFSRGWHCARCDQEIRPPSPGLFSFNNPLGACPACKGFGRVIDLDLDKALPDRSLSIAEGVVRAFHGKVAQESQRDLLRACARYEIDVHKPFRDLPTADQDFVIMGEKGADTEAEEAWQNGQWYGVRGFFDWLESRTYKMHVRVFLSRYRSYTKCRTCNGGRYQPETLNFKLCDPSGRALTLPDLAALSIDELAGFFDTLPLPADDPGLLLLKDQITSRIGYLQKVGLGYLSLDRPTRTLSGGEIERVNLTTCLGASLANTLFVMDEPSVGLHPHDLDRMLSVMRELRDKGNTLLVVEHEELILRAADHLVDIGPGRGIDGGRLVYSGPLGGIEAAPESLTSQYLTGCKSIELPASRRKPVRYLEVFGARQHNFQDLDLQVPLGVFCCVTGVSGSGKSTLVEDVLYRNLVHQTSASDSDPPGHVRLIKGTEHVDDVIMVDQSPLSRTPRSTPAVYLGIFDAVREMFAFSEDAIAAGLTAGSFSFNSGEGRCERCAGLGFEKVEMQFLSDLFIRCPECEGRRYRPHVLKIRIRDHSIHEILELTVDEALSFFSEEEKICAPLKLLADVGLGYLKLGQPLNVLSGGESQRLKLVSHLVEKRGTHTLFLFDEPTTGLHFDDVANLLRVFQRLVDEGNSLLVIEHHLEVIKSADWIIDIGPGAGMRGGQLVASGSPELVMACEASLTGRSLAAHLEGRSPLKIAEPLPKSDDRGSRQILVAGAREHNLKNITVSLPRSGMVVVTGLSGSGKSTLAFDVLFAEGQRRFLDSMSPYARQFVEQLEKPEVDQITGLPPTVAIEQRVTRGGGKSTVATITEAHHFLRLLYAKLGRQHCPDCLVPVEQATVSSMVEEAVRLAKGGPLRVLAPLVRARKGFHTDVAKWAARHGYDLLRVDGIFVPSEPFKRLERFREHTIDAQIAQLPKGVTRRDAERSVRAAISVGKGTARLLDSKHRERTLSAEMSCPNCGRAFEELTPQMFSFHSPHGWCETCRGFGEIWDRAAFDEDSTPIEAELAEERSRESMDDEEARTCPVCDGARLNECARNVVFDGSRIHELLALSASSLEKRLSKVRIPSAQRVIARDILPEIAQRLEFLKKVGLDYLALDRAARTLSGGEGQRIRLAAQLGSNLQGVLYVLDEPTIGLHARDNDRLLDALAALASRGNSLLVVEHDAETMRRAEHIVDLGPRAGIHGGEVVAQGRLQAIMDSPASLTGKFLREPMSHPIRGSRRDLKHAPGWITMHGARLHNLRSVSVRFPVNRLSVITGVSGSGKSTLMRGVLLPAVTAALSRSRRHRKSPDATFDSIEGCELLESILEVDQSPIGKTSRSTPATYTKIFDEIRKHFAQLPSARMRGYSASRFSFNNEGGRCEICQGQGTIKLEMNFLPAAYMPCDACGGKRYNPQTLEVLYDGASIGDVLEMTVEQGAEFFHANPKIRTALDLLRDTGLGYLKLGQASPTLSGGEAQRLKLVSQLAKGSLRERNAQLRQARNVKSTLYLLEEPTIGLHLADIELLLRVLHRLVDEGGTVVVIEHNLNLIAEADYVVDVGPEAGAQGGQIVAQGTPEQVAKAKRSHTGRFLRPLLDSSKK